MIQFIRYVIIFNVGMVMTFL